MRYASSPKTKKGNPSQKKNVAVVPSAKGPIDVSVLEELWFGDGDPNGAEKGAAESMAAAAGKAAGLKPFPVVAQQVMTLLSDPEWKSAVIKNAIEKDAALTSRVLRVANSPIYGALRACVSVDEALVRLGGRAVQEIVASVATLGLFQDVDEAGERIRNHCAGVAAITRVLAAEWRYRGVDYAFLSGLMHDIGKLFLIQVEAFQYDQTDLARTDEAHLHERSALGYDHAVLAAHVIEHWKIPSPVPQIVAWHHQPGTAYEHGGDVGVSVAFVRIADRIECKLSQTHDLDEAWLEELLADGSFSYADLSKEVIHAMWPKFVKSYTDFLTITKA